MARCAEATAKTATAGPWEFEGDDPTDDEIYSVHDGIVDLVGVTVTPRADNQPPAVNAGADRFLPAGTENCTASGASPLGGLALAQTATGGVV